MNGRIAAEVALGVTGIYLLASGAPGFAAFAAAVLTTRSTDPFSPWVGITGVVTTAVCAVVLLLARRRLAAWLCPNAEQPADPITPDDLHAAAISVVGVLVLTGGLTGIAHAEALVASHLRPSRSLDNYAEALVSIVVGLLLFVGARGVVALWHAAGHAARARDS